MVLGILQARMSSSRLPGKVMKSLCGQPMLARQLERLQLCKNIDKLVVATSDRVEDDLIFSLCQQLNIDCFRGDLNDVLDRFYQCTIAYSPDVVVRMTADCPLTDPYLVDRVIKFFKESSKDYVSNILERTFPHGLDVEVVKASVLTQAWQEAEKPYDREHVTTFIWSQPDRFKLGCVQNKTNQFHMRWTVDEPADFEFVTKIYEALYQPGSVFTTEDIIAFVEKNPEVGMINRL